MKKIFVNYSLYIITGIVILMAILVQFNCTIEKSAQIGDWLAGFAGTLAFLWLIAGFQQQKKQLVIQSEELKLQREAIQLQAKELKGIGKFSALEQVRKIVENAVNDIEGSDSPIKKINEIVSFLMNKDFVNNLDIFFDSKDRTLIFEKYQVWAVQEAELRKFIARISTALKIYLEQSLDEDIEYNIDDLSFLKKNIHHIKSIPYLNELDGIMQGFVMLFVSSEPMLKKIQLAGLSATIINMDSKFQNEMDKGMLDKLANDLDTAKLEYPEIYKLYKKQKS